MLAAGPAVNTKSGPSIRRPVARSTTTGSASAPVSRVDEHHAALIGSEAGVAPPGEHDNDRAKGAPEFREDVLVARRVCLVLAAFEQPAGDETLQPAGEQARRDAQVLLELVEAGVAVEGVVEDQQRPPLADQPEGGRQRAFPVLEPDPLDHVRASGPD